MTQKQIARIVAIRKSIRTRQAANDRQPEAKPARRAGLSVTHDPMLAACIEASGFEEHRTAA